MVLSARLMKCEMAGKEQPTRNAIATISLRGTLEEKLRAAAAGFAGVEVFENDLIGSSLPPREVRALLDDLGLACMLYQPFSDFEGMPDPLRQRAFDRAERKFDLMAEPGTDRILVCSNCAPASLGDRQRTMDDFRELGERAAVANNDQRFQSAAQRVFTSNGPYSGTVATAAWRASFLSCPKREQRPLGISADIPPCGWPRGPS